MLVLLTKRKLRPDGCQTAKPPGILAMPNIFSPPFFFRKLLRQINDFFRIPRMRSCSRTNIPNPLKFILFPLSGNFISLSVVLLLCPIQALCCQLSGTRFVDLALLSWLSDCRWRPDPDPDPCLIHHLCSHQCCQAGTRSSHCKQNPTVWTCQEFSRSFLSSLELLLARTKQVKNHLEKKAACSLHLMPYWLEGQIWTKAVVRDVTVSVWTGMIIGWGYNSAHTVHCLLWVAGVRLS